MNATYTEVEGRGKVAFERQLGHPIDRVWHAITEPDELAHWFPSSFEGELRVGAPLRFVHEDSGTEWAGEVRELDPPRRLVYTWGEDLLEFELESIGQDAGCLLRLVATMGTENKAARDAAGWHVCLDRLDAWVGGADAQSPLSEPAPEWRAHYEAYLGLGFPAGAALPT
jgi:uncharacterized protein YndB with AHSA1/START domain